MMAEYKKLSVLGVEYTVKEQSQSENPTLTDCDGYSDWTTKEIVVAREVEGTLGDMEAYIKKVLRHEIVPAFLVESGLHECSGKADAWATNESMVDWIARQGQKIYKAWEDTDALDV